MLRLFVAADIHGSELCWRKFINAGEFYGVDVLVLGGDIAGRGVRLVVRHGSGEWHTEFHGRKQILHTREELQEAEAAIRNEGLYPHLTNQEEAEAFLDMDEHARMEVFRREATRVLEEWIDFAENRLGKTGRRLVVIPGNDDPPFVDDIFEQSEAVTWAHRHVVRLSEDHELVGEGYSNPTPWNTPRELTENALLKVLETHISKVESTYHAIFLLHAPPYKSSLDDAPLLDTELAPVDGGSRLVPVGSTAVRRVIETHQPLLSLHGHVHEKRGFTSIGRTLCLNPGSICSQGNLAGYLVTLEQDRVDSFQPVLG